MIKLPPEMKAFSDGYVVGYDNGPRTAAGPYPESWLRGWNAGRKYAAEHPTANFDPDQPRDEKGRWTDGGGSDDNTDGGSHGGSETSHEQQRQDAAAVQEGGRQLADSPRRPSEQFYEALRRTHQDHPFGPAVEVKPLSFYDDPSTKLFMADDHLAGVAVSPDGDLVSVFKHPSSHADIDTLLAKASENAKTLDCFNVNGFLPDKYSQFGWRPAARIPFNDDYAPEGWDTKTMGRPDVVLMVHDPEGVSGLPAVPTKQLGGYKSIEQNVPTFTDYDTAMVHRQAAVDKVTFNTPPSGSIHPTNQEKAQLDREAWRNAPPEQKVQLHEAYDKALAAKPEYEDSVRDIANKVGGKMNMGPIKGMARVLAKVNSDAAYGGDPRKVKDILRSTIEVDSMDKALLAKGMIGLHYPDMIKAKDRMTNPGPDGYRDMIFHFRTPSGAIAEVQINVPEMLEAKSKAHGLYEQRQAAERRGDDKAIIYFDKTMNEQFYGPAWHAFMARAAEHPTS